MSSQIDRIGDGTEFVRTDVSLAVLLTLVAGCGLSVLLWNGLVLIPFAVLSYVFVGITTVYEWNQKLHAEGMVTRTIFTNITTAVALPAALLLASLLFTGTAVVVAGPLCVGFVIAYEFLVYLIGFRGIETDAVYFETDPLDGESRVYKEALYISRLEEWAVQQQD